VLILAFDTSGFAGSLALLDGARILAEAPLDPKRRSAQTLAPAIAELLGSAGIEPAQIRLVATTVGPGSFTGLRVGVTTAKTFAYVVGAEVMAVSTLEVIAHSVPADFLGTFLGEQPRKIEVVIDAQRKEFFLGRFRAEAGRDADDLPRMDADGIVSIQEWVAALEPGTIVTGPGLARVESQLPADVVVVPAGHREPKAAVVGRLAWRDYQAGRRDDLWKLAPLYLRPSYAEEKRRVREAEHNAPPK
jgi:tRNA threonylcarbamoyladenosine biosynthesis protein TsaB